MWDRPDPECYAVLELNDAFALSASCVDEYREKGHTCVRGLATREEVEVFRPAIENAASAHNFERRAIEDRETYGKSFLQTINLWVTDAAVQAFVFSQRFARVAAELMGVEGVRLYHDQALFKEPGGGPTPWHQDLFYWPLDTDRTITLWMPLVDIPAEVGSMHFASSSQHSGHLGEFQIGDESQRVFDQLIPERGFAVETHGAMSAGDATFHSGWTLHSAGPNPTGVMRSVMTVIYFPDGTRVAPLNHTARRVDHAIYLPDCAPGELAASPLTPRLYPAQYDSLPDPPAITSDYRAWLIGGFQKGRAETGRDPIE